MIYFMQILKMLNKEQRELFIDLFDDLSFELDDMGYRGHETDLVNEMLDNHLGLFIEDDRQLKSFTEYILKEQNKLEDAVKRALLYMSLHK